MNGLYRHPDNEILCSNMVFLSIKTCFSDLRYTHMKKGKRKGFNT